MARLIDITGKAVSGEWGTDDLDGSGIPVLRTTNFTNTGEVSYANVVTRSITKKNISNKFLRKGDIIIEKSGGSDKQPVGRVIYFEGEENKYLFNNFTGLLRVVNSQKWHSKYVFYSLYAYYQKGGTRAFENKTTGLHNLKLENYINAVEVRNLSIEIQAQRSFELDKLRKIITLRRTQLAKLDELVKCRFVEMFGDMIYNPNKWEEKALQSVADIVSGITKGRKISDTKLIEVPYMSVCNVKDGYIDWTNLKTILATNKEIEQYRILANDVLMTEGGDPDKVGRGAIISSPPNNCIHQNHIFRVRLSEVVEAIYFEQYLQQPKARQYFYRSAKQTTGIASINMSQLKAMPVLLPPLALQERFSAFVRRIEKLRIGVQAALDKAQQLFDSLMQEYFG